MVTLALKVTSAFISLMIWFGFILPYLVSSKDDLLVAAGVVVTCFGGVYTILSVAADIGAIQRQNERKDR